MFREEKTRVFWWGLIIMGASVVVLFTTLWYPLVIYSSYSYYSIDLRYYAPPIFGSIVFLLIGLYMMISGVRKTESSTTQSIE